MKLLFLPVFVYVFLSLIECESTQAADLSSDSDASRDVSASVNSDESESGMTVEPPKMNKRRLALKSGRRDKKSLPKSKVRQLAKSKYLQAKLRSMVEHSPVLKNKIKNKLRKFKRYPNTVSAQGPDGPEEIDIDNPIQVYEMPVFDFKMFESPTVITHTDAFEAQTGDIFQTDVVETLPPAEVAPGDKAISWIDSENNEIDLPVSPFPRPRVHSRSVYTPEMLTVPEVIYNIPNTENEIGYNEIIPSEQNLQNQGCVSYLIPVERRPAYPPIFTQSEVAQTVQVDPVTGIVSQLEPLTEICLPVQEITETADSLSLAAENQGEDETSLKLKKEVDVTPCFEEGIATTLEPSSVLAGGSFMSYDSGLTTHYVPVEPIKTHEMKTFMFDPEAVVNELKSFLGELSGPVIIGEPGEPVILKHYAKPYVIEYYERPVVVEHHQKAILNVQQQAPVIVDHFEAPIVNEIEDTPFVSVQEVCPEFEVEELVVVS